MIVDSFVRIVVRQRTRIRELEATVHDLRTEVAWRRRVMDAIDSATPASTADRDALVDLLWPSTAPLREPTPVDISTARAIAARARGHLRVIHGDAS